MKLRQYLILAASLLLACPHSLACVDQGRDPHCYMFSSFSQNEEKVGGNVAMNVKFWMGYTGKHLTEQQILDQLNNQGSDLPEQNALLTYVQGKRDKNGVEYLSKLKEMKKLVSASSENSWDYPSKQQVAQNKAGWTAIYDFALGKVKEKRTPLTSRYVLMAMRGAFYAGNQDEVNAIWTNYGKLVREPDLKAQCEGYMASGWLKAGWTEKARNYYIKSGALSDLRSTFPQSITARTIYEIYGKEAESNSFPYLIEYYLNSIFSDLHPRSGSRTVSDSAVNDELKQFVQMAEYVVKTNPKGKQAALWQSAKGYAYYLMGEKQAALTEYYQAQKMRAAQLWAFNTRCLVLEARCETEPLNDKLEAFLIKELTWLRNTAAKEKPYKKYPYKLRNHYTDVMDHLVYDILAPKYKQTNRPVTATVLINVASELSHSQYINDMRCSIIPRDSLHKPDNRDYSSPLFTQLDSLSIDVITNYASVMNNGGGTALEQAMVPFCYTDANLTNDLIATKYMREFKFKQALTFLKLVDTKTFAPEMPIYPYLGRSSSAEMWSPVRMSPEPKMAKKSYDQKTNFCKRMLKLEDAITKAQKKKKMDDKYAVQAYEAAVAYAQASPVGKCWALTNYRYTTVPDSAHLAEDVYIKRAQTLLRSAYAADKSENNVVKCLVGMFYLGRFSQSADHGKLAKLLLRLKDTPTGQNYNLHRCDVLASYKEKAVKE